MQRKPLGQTGCLVSPIGLGTVKLGRNQGVKYPTAFSIPDDKAVKALLSTAQDCGINVIDTAPAYGDSETRLGKLLPGPRDTWHIVSKVGEEFVNGESRFDFTPEHTRMSIERSLKRLKTDVIDTLLVHSDGNDTDIIQRFGIFDVLADLKKEGLIRFFGMSSKTLEGGLLTLEQADIAMVTFNLQDQSMLPVLNKATELNKGIFIKKAFSSGHACMMHSDDPITASLRCVFSQPSVSSVIIGTINPQHVKENVEKYISIQN